MSWRYEHIMGGRRYIHRGWHGEGNGLDSDLDWQLLLQQSERQ